MNSLRLRTKRKDDSHVGVSPQSRSTGSNQFMKLVISFGSLIAVVVVFGLGGFLVISTMIPGASKESAPLAKKNCLKRKGLPTEMFVKPTADDDPTIGHPEREKTTVVFIGYSPERFENYDQILPKYGEMVNTIDRVLLLWNNQEECPPPVPAGTKVPIYVIPQNTNSLNNRLGLDVDKYARTRSILHVDDDLFLSEKYIRKMIVSWVKGGINGVVGSMKERRFAHPAFGYGDSIPKAHKKRLAKLKHNVVITRSMLMGRKWIGPYSQNAAVLQYVDGQMNCEDIMMSALVRSKTGGRNPEYVKITEAEPREELPHAGGLSDVLFKKKNAGGTGEKGGWFKRRADCVYKAQEFFGENVWS